MIVVHARQITGPRRHNVRSRPIEVTAIPMSEPVPMPAVQTVTQPPAPVLFIVPAEKKTHLEQLLDQSGIDPHKRPIAQAVLGLIDQACIEKLQTFSVLYNHPKHRGLAGRGVILLTGTVPDAEFIGLLMHEALGHFRDLTCLSGNPASGASAFRDSGEEIFNDDPSIAFYSLSWVNERQRKVDAKPEDFVTGYAHDADNFEDAAESVTYYMTQEKAFRERAAQNPILAEKLAWVEKYLPKPRSVAEGDAWDGKIAWDATKLPFTWVGGGA